jgi:hypothetical protein
MRRLLHVVAALFTAAAVLVGCDTLNWSQYRIVGVAPTTADATRIASALESVASREHMAPSSPKNHAEDTFVSFSAHLEPPLFLDLTARYIHGDVLVDLAGPFGPKVPGFAATNAALHAELSSSFGARLSESKPRLE